jgi:hypothetical protein
MADNLHGEGERRIFSRMGADMDVLVWSRGKLLGRYRVRDLGLGGVFIDAGSQDLYPNDLAELAFPDGAVFRAVVIRHAEHGVGLMFHDHDEGSLDALRDLMLAAAPERSAPAETAQLRY